MKYDEISQYNILFKQITTLIEHYDGIKFQKKVSTLYKYK